MDQNLNIAEVFESAVNLVKNLPKEGPVKPSDEVKLKLYAYFKQATHGVNDTPKPRFYQIVEAYKWDAWHKLGDMSRHEAMLNYIRELKQIMETIPRDETDPEDSKHFEDVLGFGEWNKQQQQQCNRDLRGLTAPVSTVESQTAGSSTRATVIRSNDTQSNSSSGSSVSMLDDTHSASSGEGYKSPTSLAHRFNGQMGDQFALAILRLQHGLDETIKRVNKLEAQLKGPRDTNEVRSTKQTGIDNQQQTRASSSAVQRPNKCFPLWRLFNRMGAIHWFYLSYPIVVYLIMRAREGRSRKQ